MAKPLHQLQRVRFRDDQLLCAHDLQDVVLHEDWLRRLHTRTLHHTWGIADGLGVVVTAPVSSAIVTPGLAYDSLGRELILPESQAVPLAGSEAFGPDFLLGDGTGLVTSYSYLVLYLDEQTPERPDARHGCQMGLGTPWFAQPRLAWRRPDEMRAGLDIVLARITEHNGSYACDLSVRRRARPLRSARLRAGRTPPGAQWSKWNITNDSYRWLIDVDTSIGCFTRTPYYFASLAVNPFANLPFLQNEVFLLSWIVNETNVNFRFVVLLAYGSGGLTIAPADLGELFKSVKAPAVTWLAVEPSY